MVPLGHTPFSWRANSHRPPPFSHTNFSWSADLNCKEVCEVFNKSDGRIPQYRESLASLVYITFVVGKVDHSLYPGPASFRSRRSRLLSDGPTTGLSISSRIPVEHSCTNMDQRAASAWQVTVHDVSGGMARFSLKSRNTGRFLREAETEVCATVLVSVCWTSN